MTATTKPAEGLARLRERFGPEHVGLLPRITCKACSENRAKVCDKHNKNQCRDCGNWITERHIHLNYVGHGAVTDRLLEVDPAWQWEPLAFDQSGMPTMIYDDRGHPIAMWIKLTVLGVTRLGVGTCSANQPDAEKVLIGDALRNAAMRFGVALDLWITGQAEDSEQQASSDERSGPQRSARSEDLIWAREAKAEVLAKAGGDKDAATQAWHDAGLEGHRRVTAEQLREALAKLADPGDDVRDAFTAALAERETPGPPASEPSAYSPDATGSGQGELVP